MQINQNMFRSASIALLVAYVSAIQIEQAPTKPDDKKTEKPLEVKPLEVKPIEAEPSKGCG